MERIPDADYIREAERLGIPPYESSERAEKMRELAITVDQAMDCLDKAVNNLLDAEDDARGTEFEDDFRALIEKVQDAWYDIKQEKKKIKGA